VCTVLKQDLSGSGGLVSDMDAFSQKLATIVAADYTHAALVSHPTQPRIPAFRCAACSFIKGALFPIMAHADTHLS
jgi:hypothetical protein